MLDRTTLERILNDPDSTAEERELARRELGIESPATPASSTDAELKLNLLIYGPELKVLLDFAGVARLSDLTVDPMRRYADAQPKPLSKSTLRALSCCSARALWPQIKAAFPESQWRAEFTKIAVERPYLVQDLAYRNNEDRQRFHFWGTMCETRDAYAVRVYLLKHVHEVLNGLKEFQFELREEIQVFINEQEKRWSN